MKKTALLLLLCVPATAVCQVSPSADVALQAMNLPVGAAASGMAGAFSTIADDPSALYWNPAGMAFQRRNQIQSTYSTWLMQTSYQDVSALIHAGGGVVAARLTYVGLGSFILRDDFGAPVGTATPHTLGVNLGVAKRFKRMAFGLSGKTFKETISGQSLTGYGLDAGALARLKTAAFSLGCRNIGSASGYSTPADGYLGASITTGRSSFRLRVATDADSIKGRGFSVHHGVQAVVQNAVCFRVGYEWDAKKQFSRQSTGFGAGFGFQLKQLEMDYSVTPFKDLGLSHKITATYLFNAHKKGKQKHR